MRSSLLPHGSSTARPVLLGAVALALGLTLTGVGWTGDTARAAGLAGGGPVTSDPSSFLARTGAVGYADPATPALRTVTVSTSAALAAALQASRPGDHIELTNGTFTGPFTIRNSGTMAAPIVIGPAAGAKPVITAAVTMPSCDATGPDENRAIAVLGADHVVLSDLRIVNGVKISGDGADSVTRWQDQAIATGDWRLRRTVPGSSAWDPTSQRTLDAWFSTTLGTPVADVDDVQVRRSTITGKGIFGRGVAYSVLSGNTITHVACGTGPGVWFSSYSHGSVITGNDVSDVAHSTAIHYMQEGIRLGNGSDYNVVSGNVVHDLAVGGRAFTTDQDASFDLYTHNTATHVDVGFNEEMSPWGNTWSGNLVDGATSQAYSIRMEDAPLTAPSRNSSSWDSTWTCNLSRNATVDLSVGAMAGGTFLHNGFSTFLLNKRVAGYWGSVGNTVDGSIAAPRTGITLGSTTGC